MNRHAVNARKKADEVTEEAVVDAFGAGLGMTQIATELDVSVSKVRGIRDKHGIAPDPRYAHLRPPTSAKEGN